MQTDRIRMAQLGVGRWGHHLLRNFLSLPQVQVVAVVEPQTEYHGPIREKFGLSPDDVAVLTDAETVLSRVEVDAIAIATPATTHYKLIKTALQHGKHVLAEKPLTLDVAECEELCALAVQQNVQLVVDHTYLFHPAVQKGRAVLASQPLGQLRYGYATRTNLGPVRSDVDALWDLSIHDIAIFNHWLGEQPIAVSAQGQVWLQGDRATYHSPSGLADVVWLRLFYPSGFQATIHVSWANPDKQRRLCVVGDRGTLIFDEMQSTAPLVLLNGTFSPTFDPLGLNREVLAVPPDEPLQQVCQHFVQRILSHQTSTVSSGTVGTDLVRILVALSQALTQDGATVPVGWRG